MFTLEELLSAAGGRWIAPPSPRLSPEKGGAARQEDGVRSVSTDSRALEPGALFVAIRGRRFDGHDFVEEAFRRGAAAAVVEQGFSLPPGGGRSGWGGILVVPDTLCALGDLARFHRSRFHSLKAVAVTGSSGKTTTRQMLTRVLEAGGPVLATPGTQNNRIGVPLTLLRLAPEHAFLSAELGTNRWGEIRALTECVRPQIGIVTCVGRAHLETFGDLRGVLRAKGELWGGMDEEGTVILNADDPLLRAAGLALRQRVVWYSLDFQAADFWISDARESDGRLRCRVNGRFPLELDMPGRHNLANALAAVAGAVCAGISPEEAVGRLNGFSAPAGRLRMEERDGIRVLDDSYNANPDSLRAALEVFSKWGGGSGRRAAALGDMLELGDQAERFHEEAGRRAAASGLDLLVAVGPLARRLLAAAWEAGLPRRAGRAVDSAEEAAEILREWLRPGDALLVKGSRAVHMEKAIPCSSISAIP